MPNHHDWKYRDRPISRREVDEYLWRRIRWILHGNFPVIDESADGRQGLDEVAESIFDLVEQVRIESNYA